MEIIFKPRALLALEKIVLFVEDINTQRSGKRFWDQFIKELSQYTNPKISYNLFNNQALSNKGYSCVFIEKWGIASKFKMTNLSFTGAFGDLHFINPTLSFIVPKPYFRTPFR